MTESERIEYQAETARLRAANVARVQQDAANLRAYDKATRDALQALRDTDHATAVLANVMHDTSTPAYVLETAAMMLRPENNRDAVVTMDHATALLDNLPCELCGRIKQHPNHQGARHMHRPAASPEGRAFALLGRMGDDPMMVVPDHIYVTARMMVAVENNPADIVTCDHYAAHAEYTHREKASAR